jgi:hypothetical protein
MKQPKKHNRPDTPLANTPEPVGMQQDRLRQEVESIKGGYLRLMQEKRDKEKRTKERNAMEDAATVIKNFKNI